MYLYVEMFDGQTAFMDANLGCSKPTSCRRIVKIKLTEEQKEMIKPKKIGEFYETVNPICFQED